MKKKNFTDVLFVITLSVLLSVIFNGCEGKKDVETKVVEMNQTFDLQGVSWQVKKAVTMQVLKPTKPHDPVAVAKKGKKFLKVYCHAEATKAFELFGDFILKVSEKGDAQGEEQSYIKAIDFSKRYLSENTSIMQKGPKKSFTLEEIFEISATATAPKLIIEKKDIIEVVARAGVKLQPSESKELVILAGMQDFINNLDGTHQKVKQLLNKHKSSDFEDPDAMGAYDLKDAKIYDIQMKAGITCYKLFIKAGVTTRKFQMCWKDNKLIAVRGGKIT